MGTHFKGLKKEICALNSFIKLMRAADSLNSKVNNELAKVGLSESQFNVLDALYHLGPLTQKDLGKKLLRSGGNITMVIDNLEKRRYVKRKRWKDDRRFYIVHITEKGEEKIKNVLPGQVKLITEQMNGLNKNEQLELQKLCKKVGLKD
ncbi:HTH-type transcriptional regulator MhqR [bacterium BMS3Abin03]|nr:HTH-type transcriptional regulator MhqR [bacterium BMS3Abin03]